MLKARIYKEDKIAINIYAPNNTEILKNERNKTVCVLLIPMLLNLEIPPGTWGKCTWSQFHFTTGINFEQNENKRVNLLWQNVELY